MPDDRLDHIHSESSPAVLADSAREVPPAPTDDAEEWASRFTAPAPAAQDDEEQSTDDDTAPAQEAAQDMPEPEHETEDARDRRIARLANDVREKNRKLAQQQAEIERLKGMRTESRDQELDRLAEERASEKLKAKEFNSACDTINKAGMATYGQSFRNAVDAINDVCNDFNLLNGILESVVEAAGTTDGHTIIKHLGDNVDILEDIVGLPPHRQGAAIAKLAAKLSSPAVKPVSKAPAPIKKTTANAVSTSSNVDPMKMSMEEFAKWSLDRDRKRGRIH